MYWIQKNEFLTASFKYLLNGYFALEIFDARLEPILTKKILKTFIIDFLLEIVTPFNNSEFGEGLAFAFKVAIDLIPFQVCRIFKKTVLIIFFGVLLF